MGAREEQRDEINCFVEHPVRVRMIRAAQPKGHSLLLVRMRMRQVAHWENHFEEEVTEGLWMHDRGIVLTTMREMGKWDERMMIEQRERGTDWGRWSEK